MFTLPKRPRTTPSPTTTPRWPVRHWVDMSPAERDSLTVLATQYLSDDAIRQRRQRAPRDAIGWLGWPATDA
jgi:hypothetical protein